MKTVHINSYDITGGAARAAYRLHKGLIRVGHSSQMYVMESRGSDPEVVTFQPRMDLFSRVRRHLRARRIHNDFAPYVRSRPSGYDRFTVDRSAYGAELLAQLPVCDIINLHWVAEFVDYAEIFTRLPRTTPIVWTLHDMNAFTGGCHFDVGCGGYLESCGQCPQLGSVDTNDLSSRVWQRKRNLFARLGAARLRFVAPSQWLAREAKRSGLGRRFAVTVIPYGLDVDEFAPRNRASARDVLGISRNAAVVLFVADAMTIRRKGYSVLAHALSGLRHRIPDLFLLSLGRGAPPLEIDAPGMHLESLNNDRLLSVVYSAADLLVAPSLQDNLPNTVLESMACGTPVVGFDIGGIPDMVRPNVTGLVTAPNDVPALRAAITDLLDDSVRRATLAENCRRIAVQEYALEVQARRYEELYGTMLKENCAQNAAWAKTPQDKAKVSAASPAQI